MTDDKIVKGLECHKENAFFCAECPYKIDKMCSLRLCRDALNLINRQQAEIERLQKYNTDVAFKHYNDGIKEFAERLKAETKGLLGANFVDNLVEEMVGDTE